MILSKIRQIISTDVFTYIGMAKSFLYVSKCRFFAYFYEELLKNYYILFDGNKLYRKIDMLSAFAYLFSLLLIEKHYLFNKNKNNTCS